MSKANTEIVWLVLLSLLTAGLSQAMILTAAPTPHAAEAGKPELVSP